MKASIIEMLPNEKHVLIQTVGSKILFKPHRNLDNSVFVSFPEICFVLIMYCNLSHMVGHVISSANDQLYTIKINKDFLMRLLKRGVTNQLYSFPFRKGPLPR